MQNRSHLAVLIHSQAKKYGKRTALIRQDFGGSKWTNVSWNQFSANVKKVSNALLALGLKPHDKIAVFSQNCAEYLYTDFGAYGIRVVSIPFYATTSGQQVQYMVNDADVRLIFVGEQEQYDKAHNIHSVCSSLERIIVFDRHVRLSMHDPEAMYFDDFLKLGEDLPHEKEVEALWKEANDDDLCNILYTSGTTGDSKGVMLTYGQYSAALKANDECVPIDDNDRVINFLPFTHIFERGWAYLAISEGCTLIVNTDPHKIQQSMRETHPTCMSSVPRFWEKVYQAVRAKIDRSSSVQQKMFYKAWSIGKKYNVDYLAKGKRPPLSLRLEYAIANKTVLSLVRAQIGLEHPNIFPTAGAYVSPDVQEFVHSIGIGMVVGYGLTESLATVSCNHLDEGYTIGSVGQPINGIEIKIGENSEILLKGPTITKGYYKRPEQNKAAFDEDGFFHTGDAGYIRNGELFLTERIKDLFKTSNGKYIAPQMIESLLLVDKFVDQVAIVADQRKFVSALVVPEYGILEEWARERGIKFADRVELCKNKEVNAMMMDRIDILQQSLAHYEQIKRFTLLPHHFSMERGEMTNTLKLRRSVVNEHYKDIIDGMYANTPSDGVITK